jgi:hypothetical protein
MVQQCLAFHLNATDMLNCKQASFMSCHDQYSTVDKIYAVSVKQYYLTKNQVDKRS